MLAVSVGRRGVWGGRLCTYVRNWGHSRVTSEDISCSPLLLFFFMFSTGRVPASSSRSSWWEVSAILREKLYLDKLCERAKAKTRDDDRPTPFPPLTCCWQVSTLLCLPLLRWGTQPSCLSAGLAHDDLVLLPSAVSAFPAELSYGLRSHCYYFSPTRTL